MSEISVEEQCQQILLRIGEKLSEARKANSGVVQKIAKSLKIRASLLQAMEGGDIDEFPGESYYYGFARNYADFLAVDISDDIRQFRILRERQDKPQSIDSKLVSMATSSVVNDQKKIAAAKILSKGRIVNNIGQDTPQLSMKNKHDIDWKHALKTGAESKSRGGMLLVSLGFFAVFVYAVWTIFSGIVRDDVTVKSNVGVEHQSNNIAEPLVATENDDAPALSSEFKFSEQAVGNTGIVRSSGGREFGSPVGARVWIQAIGTGWVSVVDISKVDIDNGVTGEIFARELKANDVFYVPQGDQIFLKSGNAGAIRLVVDSIPQEPLGRKGQVRYASLDARTILGGKSITEGVKLFELLQAVKRSQNQ